MSFDTRSQSASLPTYARRAFGGLSTSFRAFVRSTRQPQSQQRQALREIITSSSTGHSIPDNRPQTKLKAAANFLQTTQNKGQDHSEPDARPAQERPHKQSSASLVFQHFLATEGLRDEEIRLLLRQDRAVGVAAMTFTSLAAEGLGQVRPGAWMTSAIPSPTSSLQAQSRSHILKQEVCHEPTDHRQHVFICRLPWVLLQQPCPQLYHM